MNNISEDIETGIRYMLKDDAIDNVWRNIDNDSEMQSCRTKIWQGIGNYLYGKIHMDIKFKINPLSHSLQLLPTGFSLNTKH